MIPRGGLLLALFLPACSYPDFEFQVDAGPAGARVPCGTSGDLCEVGEVCCFDRFPTAADSCAAPGTCPSGHSEFQCNVRSACPGSLVCCAQLGASPFPDAIDCRSECATPMQHLACESDEDCASGTCNDMLDGYPGYRLCKP